MLPLLSDLGLTMCFQPEKDLDQVRSRRLEFIASNDLPDESELPIVRELLAGALHQLDAIDETISLVRTVRELLVQTLDDHDIADEVAAPRIRATPKTLSNLRDARLARVTRFRVALAPHKKVPPEILANIFVEACENRPLSLPPHNRTRPWAISQVCARWRQVALNEPRLWNDLSVTTNRKLGDPFPARMHDVFSRSAGTGISLKIDRSAYRDAHVEATVISDTILPHLNLFRHLDLTFPSSHFSCILSSAPGLVDSLESVRLNLEQPTSNPYKPFEKAIAVFAGARSLRRIEIRASRGRGHWLPITWSLFDVPWAQLTHLCLGPGVMVTIPMAHDVLQHSSQLVDCMLCLLVSVPVWFFGSVPSSGDSDIPPIVSPSLASLKVYFSSIPSLEEFLEPLVLPSLTKLVAQGALYHEAQAELASFIRRSACSITSIKLPEQGSHKLPVNEKLLEELPLLVELDAECLLFTKPTLERISRRQLVPRLEILHCYVESPGSFVDMLECRVPGLKHSVGYPRSGFWVARAGYNNSASRSIYAAACHRLEKLEKEDEEYLSLWLDRGDN